MDSFLFETKITKNFLEAVSHLSSGNVVALPTETVYGLCALATDEEAIGKVFTTKQRPLTDPLILHVHEDILSLVKKGWIGPLSDEILDISLRLTENFWPGPLTLLLPKGPKVSSFITSGHPTVAIRSPNHEIFLEILKILGQPLVAPSANLFGRTSPTEAMQVYHQLQGKIPMIVDGGLCQLGLESTIIKILDGQLLCLRQGSLPLTSIENLVNVPIELASAQTSKEAPGMESSHYAPQKKLWIWPSQAQSLPKISSSLGLLAFGPISCSHEEIYQTPHLWNTQHLPGDLLGYKAAKKMFKTIYTMDKNPDIEGIVAIYPPFQGGLWPAIRDRLNRASWKN